MREAEEKAAQLDPLSAEAHDGQGVAYARDARWEQSERSFCHAIELDPRGSDSRYHFAMYFLMTLGRIQEAIQQVHVVERADPLSPGVHYWLSKALGEVGRYEEAAPHLEKVDEAFKRERPAEEQLRQGRIHEVIRRLETGVMAEPSRHSQIVAALGCAYVRAGRREGF